MTASEIQELLSPILAKLESLGVAGWEVAVRQSVVEGFQHLIVVLVLAVSLVFLYQHCVRSWRLWRGDDHKGYYDQYVPDGGGWMWFVFLLCLIAFMLVLSAAIGRFVNPEWYALQNILMMVP